MHSRYTTKRGRDYLLFASISLVFCGCWTSSEREIVVYSALDRDFSKPILDQFEESSDIKILANYDIESTKTVGLVNRIIAESKDPVCDVFWNNEILHTLRLQKLGLLESYRSPAAAEFPEMYVSSGGHWHGFAARARILIVNTDVLNDKEEWPASIHDLADDKWKGKVAMAKPLFGTTASHAAVLFSTWGEQKATEFFLNVKENVDVVSGNKQVAESVASGQYAFGITDTDDAIIEKDNAQPVEIVYPDQGDGEIGTLFIPNTLCIMKGRPNTKASRELVDYLLGAEVEKQLATGRSAQFPVNPSIEVQPRVKPSEPVRWMDVDFEAAAQTWDSAREFLKKEFASAD